MARSFYVTTPIYYPSDKLHIGHALTTTMADTLARFKRMQGYEVRFLTGSDEHGQKIQRKAAAANVSPQEYVDEIVASFQQLWQRLHISYDDFIRTSEGRHIACVQELFRRIYAQGDIYKSEYAGWYCTPCETFWPERQLVEGACPDCGRPVELLKEESYFFRLSNYADALLAHIESHPDFVQPVSRRHEMINFIKGGLEDLCISRTSFDWGIPVPMDPRHVVYVWFDALTNYISALGWGSSDESLFHKFWPEAVHLVGKDIVRFHTVIWPIMLMAAGVPLPKKVFGHGWLLVDGGKMSKSRGNVVDPFVLIERYGADSIRYFLLRELPYGGDGYYSEEALRQRYNTDLANDLGNLVHRSLTMIERYREGMVPAATAPAALENDLQRVAAQAVAQVEEELERFDMGAALAAAWRLVDRANKYIEETAPWNLARQGQNERLDTVLYHLAEGLRILRVVLAPFMPGLVTRLGHQLGLPNPGAFPAWEEAQTWGVLSPGTHVRRGEPLFPRLTDEEIPPEEGSLIATGTRVAGADLEPSGVPADSTGPAEGAVGKAGRSQAEQSPDTPPAEISIDEFARLDLRVARVVAAERITGADKLLKLTVELGGQERTVVAGIARHYQPQELVGKQVVVVANLKPARLRGVTSQGMVLAAVVGDELTLVTPEKEIASGAKVR
ncbi:MAG: methionine--tRNA ligase [Clostridia bacterium]|nr:MAG: methionine--tRNA ligase [Clostridia bacterium]